MEHDDRHGFTSLESAARYIDEFARLVVWLVDSDRGRRGREGQANNQRAEDEGCITSDSAERFWEPIHYCVHGYFSLCYLRSLVS